MQPIQDGGLVPIWKTLEKFWLFFSPMVSVLVLQPYKQHEKEGRKGRCQLCSTCMFIGKHTGVCVIPNLKTEKEMEVACKSMFLRVLNELN